MKDVPIQEPPPSYTGSDRSFRQAKEWLLNCLEKHSHKCSAYQYQYPLPKRILDLGDFPDGIRLLENSTHTRPYVCLSHCWGDSAHHPLQTTSQNLLSHKRGIKFADLPKTFQETATAVHRLGYRYLWIDSLCIVQDDEEDWRVQASSMANIYQGCLFTIAANAAPNSSHGLFSHLSPGARGMSLSVVTEEKADNNVWIHQNLEHERETLGFRGWVLQERVLSPRTLYFGKDELLWECLEATACQCVGPLEPLDSMKNRIHLGSEGRPTATRQLNGDWYQVIAEYTRLQLSHEGDVFPAISGVAKHFRTMLKSQYIAGLWRNNIFNDLCWFVLSSEDNKLSLARRPAKWRAPSFSWASVIFSQGPSCYIWTESDWGCPPCVRVVDVRCVPVGSDDTGQLSDAYIDLEGLLAEARVIRSDDTYAWSVTSASYTHPSSFFPDYNYDVNGQAQIVSGDQVFCLLVCHEDIGTLDCRRYYLILRRIKRTQDVNYYTKDDTGILVYERIGILREVMPTSDVALGRDLVPEDLSRGKVVVRIV